MNAEINKSIEQLTIVKSNSNLFNQYHPSQRGNEQSNRQPTKIEISTGQEFLKELIRLFDIEIVVALGNTAETTLKTMGIACQKVRHPSFGGKIMFINGINDVINSLS